MATAHPTAGRGTLTSMDGSSPGVAARCEPIEPNACARPRRAAVRLALAIAAASPEPSVRTVASESAAEAPQSGALKLTGMPATGLPLPSVA